MEESHSKQSSRQQLKPAPCAIRQVAIAENMPLKCFTRGLKNSQGSNFLAKVTQTPVYGGIKSIIDIQISGKAFSIELPYKRTFIYISFGAWDTDAMRLGPLSFGLRSRMSPPNLVVFNFLPREEPYHLFYWLTVGMNLFDSWIPHFSRHFSVTFCYLKLLFFSHRENCSVVASKSNGESIVGIGRIFVPRPLLKKGCEQSIWWIRKLHFHYMLRDSSMQNVISLH